MSYSLRSYSGSAQASTLQANIGSGDSSFTIGSGDASTWVDLNNATLGVAGTFVCVIGYGGTNEEKVLCSGISSATVTISQRGYDGTTAASHSAGEVVMPVFSANEAAEANLAVNKTIGKITAVGDMLYGDAANSLARLPIGNSTSILTSAGGVPTWNAPTSGASAALQNTTTGLQWVSQIPAFLSSYRAAGSPSISANTWTAAPLDTTNATLGSSAPTCDYTTNKGRFTINKAGLYRVSGSVTVAGAASIAYVQAKIIAGTSIASGVTYMGPKCVADSVLGGTATTTADIVCASGDKIELQALVNVATTFAVGNAPLYTFASVTYLGPTT